MNFSIYGGHRAEEHNFGILDFTIFGLTLCISAMIGVYHGFWGQKENTLNEYLYAGKKMATIPVAFSLIASFLSGLTLMGKPTEIYLYGTLGWMLVFNAITAGLITNFFYLPIFYELQCTSIYEYLELRFNRSTRIMASMFYIINVLLYVPIVMYLPALAFSQVSGLSLYYVAPVISIICIIYTMLGGMRAVIWTDFIQGIIMFVASIVFIILGVQHVGGLDVVWQRSQAGGRIRVPEMTLSPFERMTFWSIFFGAPFGWTTNMALQQGVVQKFLSLPTYSKARTSLIVLVVGTLLLMSITSYSGLVIYARYFDCDPIKSKAVSRPDQLLPYYITDISTQVYIPGLPGLFIAGILSAALSTISSYLNGVGGTIFEDFVRPNLRYSIQEKHANTIIKMIVLIIGTICVATMYIVDQLGAVFQLFISMAGVTSGAIGGIFSFGMFYPRGNANGALAGSICSMVMMAWIVFGSLKARSAGIIRDPVLPMSVEGCKFNITLPDSPKKVPDNDIFVLYRISFLYYTLMGVIIVFAVGTMVSLLTKPPSSEKNEPTLFTPILRKYLERRKRQHISDEPVQMKLLNK